MATIALGTAQLGMRYGVVNRTGRPHIEAALALLDRAYQGGIRDLDTAQDYGDSEQVIGMWLTGGRDVRVVTKVSRMIDPTSADAVCAAAERSALRLGRVPDVVLVHDPAAIRSWQAGVGAALDAALRRGLTRAIGVSVYEPAEFAIALESADIHVVQAPFNALDRRLRRNGMLSRFGGRLYLRSVFLQGLLLADAVPARLREAKPFVEAFLAVCAAHGVTPVVGAVQYAARAAPGAALVIGCETAEQLQESLDAAAADVPGGFVEAVDSLPPPPGWVVDPRTWPPTG
jgi:aryl-alcohol dehydrogenase-like predicted oxidoreductase